ncbi:O-antigen ligase family protein, partial [Chloroflexota bacterium]
MLNSLVRKGYPALFIIVGVGAVVLSSLLLVEAEIPNPLVLAAPVVLAVGILMLSDPALGLLVFTFILPIERVFSIGDTILSTAFGLAVIGAWLVHRMIKRKPFGHLVSASFFVLSAAILGLGFLSQFWAQFPVDVLPPLLRLARLFVISLLVFDLVDNWRRADHIIKALVLGAVISTVLVVEQYYIGGVRRAGSGIAGSLNNTADVLATLIPFAYYLLRSSQNRFWQALGWTYLALSTIAIAVTFSRQAFILFGLIHVIENWDAIRSRGNTVKLILLFTIAILLVVFVLPMDEIIERALTIPKTTLYIFGVDPGVDRMTYLTRGYLFRVGFTMFKDHPILGVGLQNFRHSYL